MKNLACKQALEVSNGYTYQDNKSAKMSNFLYVMEFSNYYHGHESNILFKSFHVYNFVWSEFYLFI